MTERLVFIGGFASNRHQVDKVSDSLAEYFDQEATGVPLREALRDPLALDQIVRDATVVTHSAGLISLQQSKPHEIIAVAPPIPTPRIKLIARAALKTINLTKGSFASRDRLRHVNSYNLRSGIELMAHPVADLKPLRIISRANSFEIAAAANDQGIDTTVGFMANDVFFKPSPEQLDAARAKDLSIVTDIAGEHDEMLLYPTRVLDAIRSSR